MESRLVELFEDESLGDRVRSRLPFLFNIAELESSRAGIIGMEVGSTREKILVALLIYKFGEQNVETNISIRSPEIDLELFGNPISIKSITGTGGVKVIWTVDAQKARAFFMDYTPRYEMLLAQIKWDMSEEDINKGIHPGGLFYIPVRAQKRVLEELGKDRYLKLPKAGTNPRGVEISKAGLLKLFEDRNSKCIEIIWRRSRIKYDPYKRWVDYWKEAK